jgi:serine/threonine protein phosphatase PrpC
LARLQRQDAVGTEQRLVDIGGSVVEVVGDQRGTAMLGVADGMGGFALASLDRVEEDVHGDWIRM